MAIRDNREYRNLGTFEHNAEDSEFIVRGYASTFEPYLMFEDDAQRCYWQAYQFGFQCGTPQI